MPSPRTGQPRAASPTPGLDIAFTVLLVLATVVVVGGSTAWIGCNLAATGAHPSEWTGYDPLWDVLQPQRQWPHLSLWPRTLLAWVLPAALVAGTAAAGWRWRDALRAPRSSSGYLAGRMDLAAMMPRQTTERARQLRPSLAKTPAKAIAGDQTGVLLGNLDRSRRPVRSSWEDVLLAIMAPRSGKTSALAIPAMLRAPGAVILTTNKAGGDAYTTTLTARAKVGRCWTLDPQQIAHAAREMWWDPLATADTLEGARRLAGHFVTASVDENSQNDFWSTAAQNTLMALFLAAASTARPITDVLIWLASPADRTPVDELRAAGH
ncbi:type IV secretory system conjugative DNA transfer family protein, partial [Mangrovactinospora gilvigrisea]|uniref:type IV secretory system conjugative DNA transfer family protein n=1 Tax=Mangrovactinospora gilvigrisea TaxID=1428644 RepID=UPI000AB7C217